MDRTRLSSLIIAFYRLLSLIFQKIFCCGFFGCPLLARVRHKFKVGKEAGGFHRGTGKSREPAGWKACPTPERRVGFSRLWSFRRAGCPAAQASCLCYPVGLGF